MNLNVLSSTSTKINWKPSTINFVPTNSLNITFGSLGVSLGIFRFERNLQLNAPTNIKNKQFNKKKWNNNCVQ